MTLRELEEALLASGVGEYRREAGILAEHFCKVTPADLVAKRGVELSSEALCDAVERRRRGEPLQYIIGEWYFMNETYRVNPSVLIPRPDTEHLVSWAINNIPEGGRFADLCTGSGCVAVSTLAARHDLTCVATDKFSDAVSVARENAEANGVSSRVEFAVSDVLRSPPEKGPFDAVLSNPPYVTAEEYRTLSRELYFEPREALTDGGDGLTFYRRILDVYPSVLKPGGAIAFEIGAAQAPALTTLADAHGMTVRIIKDYSHHDRVAVCKMRRGA